MSVIEMQVFNTIVHNLPRVANALERIAKALEKNQSEGNTNNDNAEQEDRS